MVGQPWHAVWSFLAYAALTLRAVDRHRRQPPVAGARRGDVSLGAWMVDLAAAAPSRHDHRRRALVLCKENPHVRNRWRGSAAQRRADPDRGPEAARVPRLRLGRRCRDQRRPAAHARAPAASPSSPGWQIGAARHHRHRPHALGTHGVPSERNAHPHVSGGISVVHNGIIENHEEMRARLQRAGLRVHLRHRYRGHRAPDAFVPVSAAATCSKRCAAASAELKGAYAIAVIADDDPHRLVVARMGAPLLLGLGEGENFAASDTSALLQVTRSIVYLEEGDCAEVTLDRRAHRRCARRTWSSARCTSSQLTADAVELGSYRHYMQKEIFEQPAAVADTLELVAAAARRDLRREAERIPAQIDARADPRLRHQLPRGHGGALLAREPRRHSLQRRDRERIPLPRVGAEPARAGRSPSRSRARPPTRSPRWSMRRALGQRTTLAICNVRRVGAGRASRACAS